ncbi:MAG: hypothetical protein ABL925_15310, partial [Methylococcales bacterium]
MIKTYIKALSLAAGLVTLPVNAEVLLKDSSEILGKWNLYAESIKLDGEKKAITVEWDFQNNGILQTKSIDSVGRTKEMIIPVKYSVANGVIKKQSSPGREKYDDCKVIEKDGASMTLNCSN